MQTFHSSRSALQAYVRPAALALIVIGLGSCSMFDNSVQFPCPQVGVPRDASTLTRFRPGTGRDLTDVIFDAKVQDVKMSCEYSSKGASVSLAVVLGAERGPADQEHTATIPYFIAITDPNRNVLAKEVFTKTLTFPPNTSRTVDVDETEEMIPLPKGKSAQRYGIVVGMQLTAEELDYNRNKNRR